MSAASAGGGLSGGEVWSVGLTLLVASTGNKSQRHASRLLKSRPACVVKRLMFRL